MLTFLGTGLRSGEFAGLRRRRVHVERTLPVLQVVDVCYQAGRFGSGFKPHPKSEASIRGDRAAGLLRLDVDQAIDIVPITLSAN